MLDLGEEKPACWREAIDLCFTKECGHHVSPQSDCQEEEEEEVLRVPVQVCKYRATSDVMDEEKTIK